MALPNCQETTLSGVDPALKSPLPTTSRPPNLPMPTTTAAASSPVALESLTLRLELATCSEWWIDLFEVQYDADLSSVITVRNDPAFTGVTSVAQVGATNSAGGGGAAELTSAAPVVTTSASLSASSSRASVSSASRQTSAAAVSAPAGSASESLTTITRTSTRTAGPSSSSKSTIGGNLVATPSSTPAAGASNAETAPVYSVSASSSISVKPSKAEAGSSPSSTTKPHVGKCNRRRSLNDRKIRKVRSQRD